MKNMKIIKNASSDSDTARIVGKMISDYLRDEYSLSCDRNCRGSLCTVDILGADKNMSFKSDNCTMKGSTIKINDDITLEEVSDIFVYLTDLR